NEEGRINQQLQAERGINYEIGARGNLFEKGLNYDVTLFIFQMKDQLVPQTVDQGNTVYLNAGETSKKGVEAALSYFWTNNSSGFIQSMRPFIYYNYYYFTFEAFLVLDEKGQVDVYFSDNEVTGYVPDVLSDAFV